MTRNLSPSPLRVGRVCVCLLQDDRILMVETDRGRWTFPGGGVHPEEALEAAAAREAWEEAVAVVRVGRFLWEKSLPDGSNERCYQVDLLELRESPEGRGVRWVNPLAEPWISDRQIGPSLEALAGYRVVSSTARD